MAEDLLGNNSGARPGTAGGSAGEAPAPAARPTSRSEVERQQHWEGELAQAERAVRLSAYEGLLPGLAAGRLGQPGRMLAGAVPQGEGIAEALNLNYIAAEQQVRLAHAASIYPMLRSKWVQDNMGRTDASEEEVRSHIAAKIWQQDQAATQAAVQGAPPQTNIPKEISQTGVVQSATGPQFSEATMRKLQEILPHVKKHSKTWGVDPYEVMLSIGEERDTRVGFKGFIDGLQDKFARGGYHSNLVLRGKDGKPDQHKGADLGSGNFAAHNAEHLLQHYAKDPRLMYRETAPSIPEGNIAKWLVTDDGTAYASAMHFRFYHDRYDPLIASELSQEDRLRMAVMFFRQGENFDNRYKNQQIELGKSTDPKFSSVTEDDVKTGMWKNRKIPPTLQGKTTPRIPQSGHDSYVEGYENKLLQLQWLFGRSGE